MLSGVCQRVYQLYHQRVSFSVRQPPMVSILPCVLLVHMGKICMLIVLYTVTTVRPTVITYYYEIIDYKIIFAHG